MNALFDLLVIGAGPAGMTAAVAASEAGLNVVCIDESPAPGGQIYTGVENARAADTGKEAQRGRGLVAALRAAGVELRSETAVWHIGKAEAGILEVGLIKGEHVDLLRTRNVLVAVGAVERPMPVVGWTLPGVMTAGAAQKLLKRSGVRPSGPVVLAGSGPLLYLAAKQLHAAGADVQKILDTTPRGRYLQALPFLMRAGLKSRSDLALGLGLLAVPARLRIPIERHVERIEIAGDGEVQRIGWHSKGRAQTVEAKHVLLHQGVIPQTNLATLAGCDLEWDATEICWRPRVDEAGRGSQPGIWFAGDCAGIEGSIAAEDTGRGAALAMAAELDAVTATVATAGIARAQQGRNKPLRRLLAALYVPKPEQLVPGDDMTFACRCEEVAAGTLRQAVGEGCRTLDETKLHTRAGMGACQGRICGTTVAATMADARGVDLETVGAFRARTPAKPIPLPALAMLADDQRAAK